MHLKQLLLSAITCLLLSSCGGGSGGLLLSEGGIGGTGISVGSITGFGSIWVNGVRYDVSEASFTRDGAVAAGQSDYRIGEIVTITGSIDADGVSGKAVMVEFNDVLEGTLSNIDLDAKSLEVLGNAIQTDALTVFHGFSLFSELELGNVLEISGSYNAQNEIKASSITLKEQMFTDGVSTLEVKGMVSEVDLSAQTFRLGTLLVDYSVAALELPLGYPENGQYVEVESNLAPQGGLITASKVESYQKNAVFESGLELELEGFVTSFTDAQQFSVSGQAVTTNASTRFENGALADIQLNSFVEVEGYINEQGVLLADEVSFKQGSSEESMELEGFISAMNIADNELMISGVTVLVDNSTILLDETGEEDSSIRFSDLSTNDFIEVKGVFLGDGRLLALRIDRELPEDEEDEED